VRLLPLLIGLAFLVLPALELWLLVVLRRHLGLAQTLGLLLASGIVGFWLAKWQGWRTLQRIRSELGAGRLPSAAMLDGAMILAAGLLLITPGLLTDVAGFLLLLPPVRFALRRVVGWWLARRPGIVAFSAGPSAGRSRPDDPDTVEGRVVSVEDADRRLK